MTEERVAEIDGLLARELPAGSVFAVGGRVRDDLRSEIDGKPRPAKDLDYVVVGVALEDLIARLRRVGSADVVGASFAVVKVALTDVTVDVALARRERSTGVGHRDFTVDAGPEVSLEDDLARRDFRMNMMARRLSDGVLVDPYGGAGNVAAGLIDVLRPAAFEEDPLRMLRACQFAARFEYAITPATMAAMRAAAPLAATVSPERLRDELIKFLAFAVRPSLGVEAMREGGLLPFVWPEIAEGIGVAQNAYHAYDVYTHNLATLDAAEAGSIALRIAALLHDVAKPRTKDGPHFYRHEIVGAEMAREMLDRLRFANDVSDHVVRLVRHHMYTADAGQEDKTIRRFIRRIGTDLLANQFALRAADIAGSGLPKRDGSNEAYQARVWAIVDEAPALSVRDLSVDGETVIAALIRAGRLKPGSRGGKDVGIILNRLLERVTDEPSLNDEVALRRILDDEIAASASTSSDRST